MVSMLPPLLGRVGLVSGLLVLKGGDFILIVPIGGFLLQLMGGFILTPLIGGFLFQLMGGILLTPLMWGFLLQLMGGFLLMPPIQNEKCIPLWQNLMPSISLGGLLFVGVYCQALACVYPPWWHSTQCGFLHPWWWCFGPSHPFLLSPCTYICGAVSWGLKFNAAFFAT
jgi:hypothetical protein